MNVQGFGLLLVLWIAQILRPLDFKPLNPKAYFEIRIGSVPENRLRVSAWECWIEDGRHEVKCSRSQSCGFLASGAWCSAGAATKLNRALEAHG